MKEILFFIFTFSLAANSQEIKSISGFEGLYFGGVSYGATVNGIGYYYLNSDSSFLFS